ncbi:MAG TPA: TetR/AcrR family transcriptional regulator [Kofleriaceae bacterium]|nr:TetR/AcrR family transcriptional regulator [Kofleriaceae bacterium]
MTPHSAGARGANAGKRERILDAAERVFARRGFYNARVSEVAEGAGVADGTIYLYFRSKDDLLISLFESRMERVNIGLAEAIAGEESAPAKLSAFIAAYLDMVRENPAVAEVLTIELRQSSKFMKAYPNPRFSEFLRLLAGIIAEGQERGELAETIPAPFAARAIFGSLDELALTWLLSGGDKFDIDRATEWVRAIILRGLERRTP